MFHTKELELLHEILERLKRTTIWEMRRAESATLTLGGLGMPLTAHLNDKPATAVFQEWDGPSGTGNKVPPTGAVTFTSSDPAVATIDATSGLLAYVAAGTATITGADAGNGLTASDTLTVTANAAQSATLTLVAPAVQ